MGTFTVAGLSAGLPTGYSTFGPLTITGVNVVGVELLVNLSSGDNTISVPPGATAVWVVLPTTNAATVKVRTNLNSGDAGLTISSTDPWGPFSFRNLSVTSLILNASSTVSGVTLAFI